MVLRLFRKRSSSTSSTSSTTTSLPYPRISTRNKLKSPHIERKYLKARSARQTIASTFGHTGLLILDSDDFVARDIANEVLGTGTSTYAGSMSEVISRGGYNNIDDASSMLSTFSSSSSIMTSKRHNDQITLKRISSYRDEERTTGIVKVRSLGIGSRRTESLRYNDVRSDTILDPFTNTRMVAATIEEDMDECSI